MKILAIIFSIIVMALTVVPCCAYDNCEVEQIQQDQSKQQEAPCSPFVQCTCSLGICITPSIIVEFVPETIVVKNNTIYKQSFTSLYSKSIWQPPKYNC